ncbi:MAG: hypothetical protein Q4D38_07270 [Planctomycetia bacterium]|nr:hypothetical protein [Planctomycetia bacterium]
MNFREIPKKDAHAHLFLSGSRARFEKLFQTSLPPFRTLEHSQAQDKKPSDAIRQLNRWIHEHLRPLLRRGDFLDFTSLAAFEQARRDFVVRFEPSVSMSAIDLMKIPPREALERIESARQAVDPLMDVRLDLGISRRDSKERQMELVHEFLDAPLAKSLIGGIDLYDVEDASPPEEWRAIFALARSCGLRLKAHVGEFGSPDSIRRHVEILDLDEIQHGIQAVQDSYLLQCLAQRRIVLNVAPESNRVLRACRFDVSPHPLRILYDSGVLFTISTDDFLLFDADISAQGAALVDLGVFSAEEMRGILTHGV